MSISINADVTSMNAIRHLDSFNKAATTALDRLSTGLSINAAKDDAANLSLSKSIEAKTSGINVANNNIQTALTQIQTFDSYLSGITESLHRTRELSIQSMNGAYADSERAMMDIHAQELLKELQQAEKLANEEVRVSSGNHTLIVQTGENGNTSSTYEAENLFIDTGLSLDLTTSSDARISLDDIDAAIKYIAEKRADLGSHVTGLEEMIQLNNSRHDGLTKSTSTIRDTDMAKEASELASNQILSQSVVSIMQQAKNIHSSSVLGLY